MNYILKNWIFCLFILSLITIVSAHSAEYFFDLYPCNMCLKQRYAYYIIIIFIGFYFLFKKIKKILIVISIQLAIIYGLFYAIWHVSIEQEILPGPNSCSGISSDLSSTQTLKEQIINQPIVNCSEVTWSILGLSAATINVILLLLILFFNSIYILRNIYDQKKNS